MDQKRGSDMPQVAQAASPIVFQTCLSAHMTQIEREGQKTCREAWHRLWVGLLCVLVAAVPLWLSIHRDLENLRVEMAASVIRGIELRGLLKEDVRMGLLQKDEMQVRRQRFDLVQREIKQLQRQLDSRRGRR